MRYTTTQTVEKEFKSLIEMGFGSMCGLDCDSYLYQEEGGGYVQVMEDGFDYKYGGEVKSFLYSKISSVRGFPNLLELRDIVKSKDIFRPIGFEVCFDGGVCTVVIPYIIYSVFGPFLTKRVAECLSFNASGI